MKDYFLKRLRNEESVDDWIYKAIDSTMKFEKLLAY